MNQENKNILSLLVECEGCKKKFSVSSGDPTIKHKVETKIEGKSIFLTYYDCHSCGRRHFVQIDDNESLRLLHESKSQFIKLLMAKRKGKAVADKSISKFNKTRKHLSDYRTKLMKDYTGKSIKMDGTDSDIVLRFSV